MLVALTRRTFIGSGLAAAGAAACRGSSDGAAMVARPAVDPDDWEAVRSQFELTPDVAHFAAFVLAAHPRPVAAAIARHRAGLDTDTHAYLGSTRVSSTRRFRRPPPSTSGPRPTRSR